MSRIRFETPGALLATDDSERRSHVPIRVWARSLDEPTVRQLRDLAAQPYVALHVAVMADAHVAEGVAVGTVFATESTVVPAALGGDLGCGMSAVRLGVPVDAMDRRTLEPMLESLGKAIPTGHAVHRGRGIAVPDDLLTTTLSTRSLDHARESIIARHLGTLGGGNHFLELERDAEGCAWLLIHSGSRGLGAAIAAHHARAATDGDRLRGLQGLDTTDDVGSAYLSDLDWALTFARANRKALLSKSLEVISDSLRLSLDPEEVLDIHHNFVARERWFGRDLLVHRKGAVAVPLGTKALIPGSMGTASYIVEGLGNERSFGSCSHGAGRVMSRKEARAAIKPPALAQAMRRVVYPKHLSRSLVEESPAAYRDIADVLDAQQDLVTRVRRLEPIAVLKG